MNGVDIVVGWVITSWHEVWTEMVFDFFTFTSVPYSNFTSVSSACEDPRDVRTELHGEEVSLFHVSGTYALGFESTIGSNVPHLNAAIKRAGSHHVRNMRAK